MILKSKAFTGTFLLHSHSSTPYTGYYEDFLHNATIHYDICSPPNHATSFIKRDLNMLTLVIMYDLYSHFSPQQFILDTQNLIICP